MSLDSFVRSLRFLIWMARFGSLLSLSALYYSGPLNTVLPGLQNPRNLVPVCIGAAKTKVIF